MEGVDVRHLHRVDVLPEPRAGACGSRGSRRAREIPAPVRATTRVAPRGGGRERRAPAGRASVATSPCHFGVALAEERADALLARPRERNAVGEARLLGLDPLVEVALVGDQLDLLDRDRRLAGERARPRQRRVEQLVVRDDAVGEPVASRPRRPRSRRRSGSSPAPSSSPTSRGRRWVPPKPGMIPSLISGWPKTADSAAMRKSQAIASSQPPPKARALTAAIVAIRSAAHARAAARGRRRSGPRRRPRPSA